MSVATDKKLAAKIAALRARLNLGGNLNPDTLSQSYGLPLATVTAEVEAHGGPYGKQG